MCCTAIHVELGEERHTDEYTGPTKPGLCADAPSLPGIEAPAKSG